MKIDFESSKGWDDDTIIINGYTLSGIDIDGFRKIGYDDVGDYDVTFGDGDDGTYTVDFDKMHDAMIALMLDILHVQGNGDYDQAKTWVKEKGLIMPQLQADLDLLNASGIPVDIVFHQGKEIMNLK